MFVVLLQLLVRHLYRRGNLCFLLRIDHLRTEVLVLWRSILYLESLRILRFHLGWNVKRHLLRVGFTRRDLAKSIFKVLTRRNKMSSSVAVYLTSLWNHLKSILHIVLWSLRFWRCVTFRHFLRGVMNLIGVWIGSFSFLKSLFKLSCGSSGRHVDLRTGILWHIVHLLVLVQVWVCLPC